LVRVPDASGVLTGKLDEKTVLDKNDHRSSRKKEWIVEARRKSEELKPIAEAAGWSITQLAIKFILSQKEVAVVLPTATDLDEIELFAGMSDGKYLSDKNISDITRLYDNNFNTSTSGPDSISTVRMKN
jgi:aryl-alcohol dehydrogenase-like predicted oxidoreductase